MRRPALWTALSFALGISLHRYIGVFPVPTMLCAFAIICICGAGLWWQWNKGKMSILFAGLLILLGALRSAQSLERAADHFAQFLPADRTLVEVEGLVSSDPENIDGDYRVVFDVIQLVVKDTVRAVSGRVLIRFKAGTALPAYRDRIQLQIQLYQPDPPRNPGAFDYRNYLKRRGIDALGTVQKPSQIIAQRREKDDWWAQIVLPVRSLIRRAIEQNLSGGPAGLLKGVLLGAKRAVPKEVKTAFTQTGVNHVLAVSGLHVGLIAGAIFFSLKILGIGRGITAALTICALVFYALITGLPPSVVRASTMGCVALLGMVGQRDIDGGNILGIAGLGLLIARPQDLFDVGFQLSFVATGGILIFYRPLRDLLPQKKGWYDTCIAGPLAVSLAAQATTLPFVVAYFGLVSVIGLIANLIVVPLIGVGVGLGLLTVLAFACWGPLATILNAANWLVLSTAIKCTEFMAEPEWSAFEVAHLSWVIFAIYLVLIPLIHPTARQLWSTYCLIIALALANIGIWKNIWQTESALEVYFLDVGQGDAIFCKYPNGLTLLVDGGIRTQYTDMGKRVILPFLKSQSIDHIDVVVGSHPHADHIGGLISVLEHLSVGHYLDAGQHVDSFTGKRLQEVVKTKGVRYHTVAAGDSLVGIGGLVLHPTSAYVSNSGPAPDGVNNGSVVIRIVYQGTSILLTGDIEHETDGDLMRWDHRLRSNILKAAHHGSRTSSTPEFLAGVNPSIVAISCGKNNRFRHPSPEVVQRFREMGIQIWRTDHSGAIAVRIDRGHIDIVPWIKNNEP